MALSRVGSWLAFTDGTNVYDGTDVDPAGSVTIGSGSNRMLVFLVWCELGAQLTVGTFTIGGQSASYTGNVYQNASPDLNILAFVWNESAIGSMSGSTISYSDSQSSNKMGWSYATFQDVKQASPTITSADATSATEVDVTTTSTANDIIIAAAIDKSNNRAPFDYDTLTERVDWNASQFSIGVADGAGGDGTTKVKNDEVANSNLAALCMVLLPATAIPVIHHHRKQIGAV